MCFSTKRVQAPFRTWDFELTLIAWLKVVLISHAIVVYLWKRVGCVTLPFNLGLLWSKYWTWPTCKRYFMRPCECYSTLVLEISINNVEKFNFGQLSFRSTPSSLATFRWTKATKTPLTRKTTTRTTLDSPSSSRCGCVKFFFVILVLRP